MKLHYYPEADSLHIELSSAPGAEAREIVEGLVVDFDAAGNVVGLDIDHASRKLDLSRVETIALPPVSAAVGYVTDRLPRATSTTLSNPPT